MSAQTLWSLEERFWTEAPERLANSLSPQCVMAFAAPVGILAGAAVLDSLRQGPRWRTVQLSERCTGAPDPRTCVLAYRVQAEREGEPTYRAYCTSTYRRRHDQWQLVQHQHTPIAPPDDGPAAGA